VIFISEVWFHASAHGSGIYNTAVNVGVIGLGFMGATHAVTYTKLPEVRIAAVSGGNAERLNGDFSTVGGNLALALPNIDLQAANKYAHWQELITDSAIEAVDICLPTDLHAEVACAALAAGKHVLCEKPMALTGEQCELMLAKARETGRVLMIGHVLRFAPAYEHLREFVTFDEAGTVQSATFTRVCGVPDWSPWLPDSNKSGGAVLDLLIHDLDQILLLFGPPRAARAKQLGDVDGVSATLLYPGGPEVRVQGGWMPRGTPFSMAFQVRTARALLEYGSGGLTYTDGTGIRKPVQIPDCDPYREELSYFQQCCDYGLKPELCPPQSSADAVKLAILIRQSRDRDGEELACAL
jgi:predicted dehydrogenase